MMGESIRLSQLARAERDLDKRRSMELEAKDLSNRANAYSADKRIEDAKLLERYQNRMIDRDRKALTDSQEYAKIQDEILSIQKDADIAASKAGKQILSEKEVMLMERMNTLQGRSADLVQRNRQGWMELGQNMSATLVNGIMEGEKLGDVIKNMLKQLAQYIIQQSFIVPLGNMIGGGLAAVFGMGGAASAGGKKTGAVGGPLVSGRQYLVGEQGPELFTPGTSGMLSSNQVTSSAGSNLSSGVTYSPVYNFASGIQANDLRPILDAHEQRVRMGIMSDIARGGGRAARFGV
jgi:hypothetical protein